MAYQIEKGGGGMNIVTFHKLLKNIKIFSVLLFTTLRPVLFQNLKSCLKCFLYES